MEEIAAALARSVSEGAGAVGHKGLLVDMAHARFADAPLGRHRAIQARGRGAVA